MARQGYVRTAAGRLAALVLEVALFLTVWGLLVPVTDAGCPQPGYFYHQPSHLCYKAFNDTATYNGAVSRCSLDGGTLAMPRDNAINNFLIYLKNFIDKNALFRFGLTDVHQERVWMWDDNVPLGDFRPWATGEPSNVGNGENCAEYYPDMYSNSWNDGPCNLAEDRKFICQASPSGVNLALGKPAYQTSSDAPADRAVDGNTDGDFFAQPGSCTHTVDGGETDPSWWVDLGQSYMVDRVVILNRMDCCSERLNPFNIHIGDSDQVSDNPKCGGDHQIAVNHPSISVACQGMRGRYVGVRLPGFHRILTLCEVQVFSDSCEEESSSVDTEVGRVTFPRTDGGSFSYSAEHCNEGNDKPLASRFCRITQNGTAVWDQPVLLMCDTDLQNLSQVSVHSKLSHVRIYTELSQVRINTKLSQVRIYTKLSQVRIYTELSQVRIYTELSQVRIYTELSQVRIYTELSQVSVYTKLSQVRIYTELSQVRVYTKLSQVSTNSKLSHVRIYTKLSQVRVYTKLPHVRVYTKLPQVRIYIKLSQVRIYIKLSHVRVYTKLSQVRIYIKLSQVRVNTKLPLVRVYAKLPQVRVYTKLSQVRVYIKLSQVRVYTKLSQVRVYTKLSQVTAYTKLSQVRVYTKLSQVRVYTKLSQVRVYTKLSQVRVYTKLSQVRIYTKLSQVRVYTKLSQIVVNNKTALSVATELQLITTQAETLSSNDVNTITATLQEIVNASATEQPPVQAPRRGESSPNWCDQVDFWRLEVKAVQALETFADTVILTTDTYTAVRPGVALQAADISPKELDKGQGFAFFSSGNNSTSLTEGDVTSFTTEDGGDTQQTADVSIALPPNISNMIQINNTSEVRLSYTLYNSSSLFVQTSQRAARPSQHAVGTRVIGGRIAGMPVKNLPEPVIITFTPIQSFLSDDVKEVTCVFWDFEAEAGQGAWSTEGCDNMPVETKGRYTCACNHLTNFALLFVRCVWRGFGDHGKPLEAISIVGCVVSIICLVLTIILLAFIVTRLDKRRTRTGHAKSQLLILINLCVALLATLIIFLAGINRTASPIGCKVVAALLHYFLLASLMWMAVEAVNVYRAVVHVFDYVSGNFIIKAGAVAWGFPLVATLSTAGPSSLYRYRMDKSCWLASEPLIYAFLIPAGLILLFNLLVFILVMRKLVLEEKAQKELRASWLCLASRGVFGFFVIADGRHVVFAYLFCIFNTLQGLFIFIFHCVMREDMKEWRKKLTCWENLVCIGKKEVYEVNKSKSSAQVSQLVELRPLSPETLDLLRLAVTRTSPQNGQAYYMFKVLHNTISVPHTSCLVLAARCSRRTNHALKLQTIASKNNYYRLSFFPRTIKEWNELEPSVAEAKSISQFKAELGRASLH
ncbi:hypothetical protein Bbelb_277660 [Branchiostoma belcheri]|nr:hypothetical protein Bbelb_277660 [Branchiostoma belcheri]